MIFDKENMFSEDQAVTASAASTNVIDLGAVDAVVPQTNLRGMARIRCQVTTNFATCDSLIVSVQTDGDEAFGSAVTLITGATVLTAALLAGKVLLDIEVPIESLERYVRLYYTIGGSSATAGKVFAGITFDRQVNIS